MNHPVPPPSPAGSNRNTDAEDALQPPVIDPNLTGTDRLREIAVRSFTARQRATGISHIHIPRNGARAIFHIRHDGDSWSVALAVAHLVAHAGLVAMHVSGESKGPSTWSLHLQCMATGDSATPYFDRYCLAAERLGLDATLDRLPPV